MNKEQGYFNLLGEWVDTTIKKPKPNPLIKYYGKGPEGTKCKECKHLYRKQYAGTYIKCDLRENTNGHGTDHKANWPTCGKFEKL